MNTQGLVLDFIKNHQPCSAHHIAVLDISRQMIHRHLRRLIEEGQIIKKGIPPRVFYFVAPPKKNTKVPMAPEMQSFIENHFLDVSPDGGLNYGVDGFLAWAEKRGIPAETAVKDYIAIRKKYDNYQNKLGLIDGLHKLQSSFQDVFLDGLYYFDFYSIERFGKTKLGKLLLHAKHAQSTKLMKEIVSLVSVRFFAFLKAKNIDAVAFLPHSIHRNIQLLSIIEKTLNIPLPKVKLFKITGEIPVAQKSLSKLSDRIENAQKTIFIDTEKQEKPFYKNLLLIDDAVGSGASLNEVARKCRKKNIAKYIWGLAFVGSFKGFEVLHEV